MSLYWTGESITNFIIVKEECLSNQFRVDLSYIKDEADKSINELALKEEIKELAISMRLSKGIIHFQIINRDGKSFFLECMRRLPGDLYSRLVELSSGWKYHCSYLAPFTNELVIDEKSAYRKTNDFLRASVSGLTKDKIVNSIV